MVFFTYDRDGSKIFRIREKNDEQTIHISFASDRRRPVEITLPYNEIQHTSASNERGDYETVGALVLIDNERIPTKPGFEIENTDKYVYVFIGNGIIVYFSIDEYIEDFVSACEYGRFKFYGITETNILCLRTGGYLPHITSYPIEDFEGVDISYGPDLYEYINNEDTELSESTGVDAKEYDIHQSLNQTYSDKLLQDIYYEGNSSPVENTTMIIDLPVNTTNALLYEPIQTGNRMVNFHSEKNHGRYYKKATYNEYIKPQMTNPFTREHIRPENIRQYTARVLGGKRKKTRRTRKH